MTDPREVQRVFDAASKLDTDARAAWLDENCDDDAVRRKVDLLLAHFDTPPTGLDQSAVQRWAGELAEPAREIGPYRLVRMLGEGAMGIVWLAERDGERVALKLLRTNFGTEHLRKRFAREAQVLRRLRHPGIAGYFDAGVERIEDASGGGTEVPFLAMELVDGQSLMHHAKREELDDRERVELFARVAEAIDYAHSQGVIHRDLKPSNVLVVPDDDGIGHPKVLDFGVARATQDDLMTLTETKTGALVGTIAYMSPEQVTGKVHDIDERSDVYSLGVLLFELLASRLPYPVAGRPVPVAARIITEDEPTRLGSVVARLRGDVELIVATALEKERERRYPTAAELAKDLRRFLAGEPIVARPPSWFHQVAKFSKRHKVLVGSVSAALVALILGLIGTLTFALRPAEAKVESDHNAEVARREAYYGLLAAATAMLEKNDAKAARVHLEATDESLRGWEWRHLVARLDESSRSILPPGGGYSTNHSGELVFRSDGSTLASLAGLWQDGGISLRVWDADSGVVLESRLLEGLHHVVLGPRGDTLVAVSPGGVLTVQSVPDLETARSFQLPGKVNDWAVARSADPVRTLALHRDGEALLWEGGAEAPVRLDHELEFHSKSLRLSPAGDRVAVSADTGIEVWNLDPADDPSRFTLPNWGTRPIAWGARGERFAWATSDALVHVFDAAVGTEPRLALQLAGHSSIPEAIAFSPDGARLATAGRDRTIRVWALPSSKLERILMGSQAGIAALAFSPDGSTLASLSTDERLSLWDLEGEDLRVLAHGSYLYAATFDPTGSLFLTGGPEGHVRMYDAESSVLVRELPPLPGPPHVNDLVVSPAGWGAMLTNKRVRAFDVATGATLADLTPAAEANLQALAVTPDGQRLVTRSEAGFEMWSTKDWTAVELPGSVDLDFPFGAKMGVDPLGRWLVTTTAAGNVQLFELDGLRPGPILFAGEGFSFAFRPDGAQLAVGGLDATLRIWNLETMSEVARLEGHEAAVYTVAYSPDGKRLVSAGEDGLVRIWDGETYDAIVSLSGHKGYVYCASFSPDGTELVTTGGDGTVRLWGERTLAERKAANRDFGEAVRRSRPTSDEDG